MPVFGVVVMLITCLIINGSTGCKLHTQTIRSEHKQYINFAHRVLKLVEIEGKRAAMHSIKPILIYAIDDSQHDVSCCVKCIFGNRWKYSQSVVSFPAECCPGLTLGCLPVPLIFVIRAIEINIYKLRAISSLYVGNKLNEWVTV